MASLRTLLPQAGVPALGGDMHSMHLQAGAQGKEPWYLEYVFLIKEFRGSKLCLKTCDAPSDLNLTWKNTHIPLAKARSTVHFQSQWDGDVVSDHRCGTGWGGIQIFFYFKKSFEIFLEYILFLSVLWSLSDLGQRGVRSLVAVFHICFFPLIIFIYLSFFPLCYFQDWIKYKINDAIDKIKSCKHC